MQVRKLRSYQIKLSVESLEIVLSLIVLIALLGVVSLCSGHILHHPSYIFIGLMHAALGGQ